MPTGHPAEPFQAVLSSAPLDRRHPNRGWLGRIAQDALGKIGLVLVAAATLLVSSVTLSADTIQGTALLRERIALPDGLTLRVVIEDIARADAPATRIAETEIVTSGQPPFAFEITYAPDDVRPEGLYAIRATLLRGDALFATTDAITRVLDGSSDPVEVLLRLVSDASGGPVPAHGLRLPASFEGLLPCPDCDAIRHHLDLWPDQVYHLSREWLGGPAGPIRRDEVGRWFADPARGAIVLYGASEMPLVWQVVAPDRLRQVDMPGVPTAPEEDPDLVSDGTFQPTDLDEVFLAGEAVIGPDGSVLRECLTGRVLPLQGGGDLPALIAAVEAERDGPDTPLLVSLEAAIVQPPPNVPLAPPYMDVQRFVAAFPGEPCPEPARAMTELTNTYWRMLTLQGEALPRLDGVPEAHLLLRADGDAGFTATVGCNRLLGGYAVEGGALDFTAVASTRMACPPPLDGLEARLNAVLEATGGYRLDGRGLVLLDAAGEVIATLEAVYQR